MPPARTDPSALNSPHESSSSPSASSSNAKNNARGTRRKTGCLTCRLRKKRCDEAKPVCELCVRLGLDCLGYGAKRPKWMKQDESVKEATTAMSNTIHQAKSKQMRSFWARKASDSISESDLQNVGSSAQADMSVVATPSGWIPVDLNHDDIPEISTRETTASSSASIPFKNTYGFPSATASGDFAAVRTNTSISYTTDPLVALQQSDVSSLPTIDLDLDRYIRAFFNLSPPSLPLSISNLSFDLPASSSVLPINGCSTTDSLPLTASSNVDISYLHHYLYVVIPLQYRFENESISERVMPLAFNHPDVFRSLSALAALHIASSRRKGRTFDQPQLFSPEDPDLTFARSAIRTTIDKLKIMPLDALASEESAVAAMCTASFYLFAGGNVKGWKETAELVRRSLAGLLQGAYVGSESYSSIDLAKLADRLGHLLSPLVWTDILISVTEGKASKWLFVYRILLLNDQAADDRTSRLLKETVMGCDSTTRLALAEVVALSEWKDQLLRTGRLSYRELLDRANAINNLLRERKWREQHLFASNDDITVQRRSISDVFYHGVRVLLAVTVNGSFPEVPEIALCVQDTANALLALDALPAFSQAATKADRALVMPIVIAGCHTNDLRLQQLFRERFQSLGEAGATFGNTGSALQLMETVWKRRAEVANPGVEVSWRDVMMGMGEEGLLLI